MYKYKAIVLSLVDGDTFDAFIDLGFKTHMKQRIRILGVDCPEKGTLGYHMAIDFIKEQLLSTRWRVVIETTKTDSFGRWLAHVYLEGDKELLADKMIAAKVAEPYSKG